MKSYDIKVWSVSPNKSAKTPTWVVRWKVSGEGTSKTFRTKNLAERFRSRLIRACEDGEPFDTETFLPDSMREKASSDSFLTFALSYVDMKWPDAAAKSRESMVDALATAVPALVKPLSGRPAPRVLRRALLSFVLPPNRRTFERPPDIRAAVRWLERASRPLADLVEPKGIHAVLDALARKLDGGAAAAETIRRKRSVIYNVLDHAVELDALPVNPIDRVKRKRRRVAESVDPRVVVNPRQARDLLAATTYVGCFHRARGRRLYALFACMYFAALRPAEAVALRLVDCVLPDEPESWGMLMLARTRPAAGKRWTDNGQVHDERGLKQRPTKDVRPVPIPPELVRILREHVATFGTAKDGRLFFSERGNVVSASTYSRVWKEARRLALPPDRVDSPLAMRPYDLRHAAVSLWLNSGVPATEVAQRAGHSVDVLLKIYAKCIDGQRDAVNRRIEDGLGDDVERESSASPAKHGGSARPGSTSQRRRERRRHLRERG